MARLNKGQGRLKTAPMITEKTPSGLTHEGAPGFARDAKTELFMRATANFAGEDKFYEKADVQDTRMTELIRKLAVEDWRWVAGFLPWLRSEGNIRTSSVMLACEAAKARSQMSIAQQIEHSSDYYQSLTPRQVVNAVLQRADEPAEAVQYCLKAWGRIPKAVKRGAADAAARLYDEAGVLRWDKPARLRFADVIELAHPAARASWQDNLFSYLLDQRHHPGDYDPAELPKLAARRELSALSPVFRHACAAIALDNPDSLEAQQIKIAAVGQWEWIRSWLGEGSKELKTALSERQQWELIIPQMGYMALLRNLRNFEQAGVKPETVQQICDRIADPEQVKRSRQFPFRFLSAHLNTHGAQWLPALEQALLYSTANVPSLPGGTLILIDTSGSMQTPLSRRGERRTDSTAVRPSQVMAAALFGLSLALKNPGKVDVYGFATGNFGPIPGIMPGASLLRALSEFSAMTGMAGHGTEMERNLRMTFDSRRHDRVAIFSDMQAFGGYYTGDVTHAVPPAIPVYAWNLAGYSHDAMAYGENRYGLAGLTDASFSIMQRLEQGKSADWPWLKE